MEFHRTVYDSDERNLIMNHAYKLDDMLRQLPLHIPLAEQKDDLPLLLETIRAAEEEIDPSGRYGGIVADARIRVFWDEMLPSDKGQGIGAVQEDVSVYQLHADGSETLVEDRAALQEHDGLFGVEKTGLERLYGIPVHEAGIRGQEPNREAQLCMAMRGKFGIYQLKDTRRKQGIFVFMAMDYLEIEGIPVSRENYTPGPYRGAYGGHEP